MLTASLMGSYEFVVDVDGLNGLVVSLSIFVFPGNVEHSTITWLLRG